MSDKSDKNLPAVQQGTTAIGQPDTGALYRAHHDEAKNLRAGRIFLKYSKGDWFIGKNAETFPENTFHFVPAMDMFERGFQCWKGGKPVDEKFVPYGTPAIPESTLPDHGPYAAGNDGWAEAIKFPLMIVPFAGNTTAWLNVEFAASSAGGKNMCYSLSKQFAEKIKLGEVTDAKPFVLCRAGTDHYVHREFGKVHYPTVEIVDALSKEDVEKLLGSAITTNAPAGDAADAVPVKPAAPDALDAAKVVALKKHIAAAKETEAAPALKYNVARDGKSTGPYTLAELEAGVEANWFKPESMVWTKGMTGWAAAETVAVLDALFEEPEEAEEEAPPPPPPPAEEEVPPPPPAKTAKAAKKTNRKQVSV